MAQVGGATRFRLRDSDVTVDQLIDVLNKWFKKVNDRCIPHLLKTVKEQWPQRGMPPPVLLCHQSPYAYTTLLAEVDPTLHPRHAKLTSAILACHDDDPCFAGGSESKEVRALMLSKQLLSMLSKYRDLVKIPAKAVSARRNSSIAEWTMLSTLCSKIALPAASQPLGPRAINVSPHGDSASAQPSGHECVATELLGDDIDTMLAEFGSPETGP